MAAAPLAAARARWPNGPAGFPGPGSSAVSQSKPSIFAAVSRLGCGGDGTTPRPCCSRGGRGVPQCLNPNLGTVSVPLIIVADVGRVDPFLSIHITHSASHTHDGRFRDPLLALGPHTVVHCTQPPHTGATKLLCPHHEGAGQYILVTKSHQTATLGRNTTSSPAPLAINQPD